MRSWLAEHARAPDGAHRRVVDPAHFAPLFGRKPRAQVMLYREALLELGPVAASYVGELSRRQRARLGDGDPGAVCAVRAPCGAGELLAAMALATAQGAYGAAYLQALIAPPAQPRGIAPPARRRLQPSLLALADLPPQAEVDRALSSYESLRLDPRPRRTTGAAALATLGEVRP